MTLTEVLLRPQPLGVLDGAAGLLLLDDGDGVAELLEELAAGRLPTSWPATAAVLEATVQEDFPVALAALGSGRLDAVNRLVLAPTDEHLAAADSAAADDPRLQVVVDAAAYASGLRDRPPSPDGVDGEFAVLAHTVRAARAIEFSDASGAVRALREALPAAQAVGPALYGRVLGMLAEHRFRKQGAAEASLEYYDAAIDALSGTDWVELRAGLQLERGLALHQLGDAQPHRLLEAIRSYQSALMVLTEERDPEQFATANMHIGIAILAMPMTQASDQVRIGVAVQSLRAALRVFTPKRHPWEWSSTQLNLANTLQYLPSTHRVDNLTEAIRRYDEVLAHRSERSDPAGCARVLANRANALAHLGRFDEAVTGYLKARALFARVGDRDGVDVIARQLHEIEQAREAAAPGPISGGSR